MTSPTQFPHHSEHVQPDSRPRVSRRQLVAGVAGAAVLGPALSACGGGSPAPSGSVPATGKPKRGGNFRLGITGGGAKDIVNAQYTLTKPDEARLVSSFETLLTFDEDFHLVTDGLAEHVTADNPHQYTIELRRGVEFHNGKTMTAEDVIYSFQRIADKKNLCTSYSATATMDVAHMKAMDKYTVRLPMKVPDSTVPQNIANYTFGIVPVGYQPYPSPQNGTGPYSLKSFTPGEQSIAVRNNNYWRDGQPYFDQVNIIDFDDSTAQLNALRSGQIDAMTDVPAAQVKNLQSGGQKVLISQTGGWVPLCMAIDMPPFDDVRVRQAMRLVVDREAMVAQILAGYGQVANDLYAPFDEGYAKDLPQRSRDITKAKALLQEAGKEGLEVDLHTTNGSAGMVELASVFAAQAKDAGIKVTVINDPNYYGDAYLKLAFSVDYWGTRGYLPQVQLGSLRSSPENETHWPPTSGTGSDFQSLYSQALAATDATARIEIEQKMQQAEYDAGGYIIPFFSDHLDGYSPKVAGLKPSKANQNLDSYAHGFRTAWFV